MSEIDLHGAVIIGVQDVIGLLREQVAVSGYNTDLLSTGRDSQAGRWVAYDGHTLVVEADHPDLDIESLIGSLLGAVIEQSVGIAS